MKTNAYGLAVLVVASLFVISCEREKSAGVVVTKDTIVLNAPEIKKSDADRINEILQEYDKTLFKFEEYQDGTLKTATGDMSEAAISKEFKAAKLKRQVKQGFSHYSGAVKCCGGGSGHATPTPPPPPPPPGTAESDPDFMELKRILENYR